MKIKLKKWGCYYDSFELLARGNSFIVVFYQIMQRLTQCSTLAACRCFTLPPWCSALWWPNMEGKHGCCWLRSWGYCAHKLRAVLHNYIEAIKRKVTAVLNLLPRAFKTGRCCLFVLIASNQFGKTLSHIAELWKIFIQLK